MKMNTENHWEQVYRTKAPDAVSWFRPHLERSLELIDKAAANLNSAVFDIGGGESTLVDDLIGAGYKDISVLDISQVAVDVTKTRLGAAGNSVT
jgi:tRNA A37 threonylcarbamoyladenosine dehydratase